MRRKKAIVICGTPLFPDGNAMSLRQQTIGKLLLANEYDVEIIGFTLTCMNSPNILNDIHYRLYPKCAKTVILKVKELYFFNKFVTNYLLENRNVPDLILVTELFPYLFTWVKVFSNNHNVTCLHDCVEYYSLDQVFGDIKYLISYLFALIRIKLLVDHSISVISISSYLNTYFSNRNILSFRLPVIMDKTLFCTMSKAESDTILRISYAGSPGRKDYLKEIITAIRGLTIEEKAQIDFTLMGIDQNTLAKLCCLSYKDITTMDCLHTLGRVPRNEVIQHLNETDFTILIRSSTARYAKAGFPTKVVESLMSSTPVILNMTSDLGMYLKDGYDCIEVEHEDSESIARALRRALTLTPEQKDQMKKNARKTAEENFDYRLYIEEFGKFINNES